MKITSDRIRGAITYAEGIHKVAPIAGEFLRTVLIDLFRDRDEIPEGNPYPFDTLANFEEAANFLFDALDVDRIGDEKGRLAQQYLATLLNIARAKQ